MKKSIIIIDILLLLALIIMIISKIFKLTSLTFIQPIFLILIITHTIQHWRFIIKIPKLLKK